MPGKPEVAELDYAVRGHENVLRLHVSMSDSVAVDVSKGSDQLLCYFSYFLQVERVVVFNNVEQFSLPQLSD